MRAVLFLGLEVMFETDGHIAWFDYCAILFSTHTFTSTNLLMFHKLY